MTLVVASPLTASSLADAAVSCTAKASTSFPSRAGCDVARTPRTLTYGRNRRLSFSIPRSCTVTARSVTLDDSVTQERLRRLRQTVEADQNVPALHLPGSHGLLGGDMPGLDVRGSDLASVDFSLQFSHALRGAVSPLVTLDSSFYPMGEGTLGEVAVPTWQSASVQMEVKDEKETDGKGKSKDYYANVGDAIRTLRAEIPNLFYRDLTYNIYRDDIVFRDKVNTFHGKKAYSRIFWSLRFHGRIFFKSLWVDIHRMWQPSDDVIVMRWTVHGVSRVPWDGRAYFDGTSEYKLDKDGKIYEHKVDNIVMSNQQWQPVPLFALNKAILAGQRATPTFCNPASSAAKATVPPSQESTGMGSGPCPGAASPAC